MTTQLKGEIGQLKVQLRAAQKGLLTSKPTTDARYDLIIDDGKRLLRAQIKYVSNRQHGTVYVTLHKRSKCYLDTEIDLLLVYEPLLDKIFAIERHQFHGKKSIRLRIEPSKNNQSKGIIRALEW